MLTVVANPPQTARPGVVLFVDDERRVLTSMRAMFRRGYTVLTANSAAEGLAIIRSQSVDVVVSDQRMPEMSGVEMLTEVRRCSPHTMRILLTGYADLEAIEASINDCEVFRYLMKPCPPDELRGAVSQALEAARAEQQEIHETLAEDAADAAPAHTAEVVVLHEHQHTQPEPAAEAPPAEPSRAALRNATASNDAQWPEQTEPAQAAGQVDVLVLSHDPQLNEAICDALQSMADDTQVHHAQALDQALDLLASKPVGVLITDMAANEREVTELTAELKRQVPTLVTILAADRSDASVLIKLINHSQVFRFLLKPVPVGQCRLWLASAKKRHLDLAASETERLRYQPQPLPGAQVDEPQESALDRALNADNDHSAMGIRTRISRQLTSLKQRFSRWSQRNG